MLDRFQEIAVGISRMEEEQDHGIVGRRWRVRVVRRRDHRGDRDGMVYPLFGQAQSWTWLLKVSDSVRWQI